MGELPDDAHAAILAFIAGAHRRHTVSLAELDKVLPARDYSSAEIEDVLALLAQHGIYISDGDGAQVQD